METFAHFDILSYNEPGKRVAEGHKASFCLEDNDCDPGVTPKYKCADFGDQGISPGCKDIYLSKLDCQWIDITDLDPGLYVLKVEKKKIRLHCIGVKIFLSQGDHQSGNESGGVLIRQQLCRLYPRLRPQHRSCP